MRRALVSRFLNLDKISWYLTTTVSGRGHENEVVTIHLSTRQLCTVLGLFLPYFARCFADCVKNRKAIVELRKLEA